MMSHLRNCHAIHGTLIVLALLFCVSICCASEPSFVTFAAPELQPPEAGDCTLIGAANARSITQAMVRVMAQESNEECPSFDTFCPVPAAESIADKVLPVSFETFRSARAEPQAAALPPVNKILLFGAKWCKYCKAADDEAVPYLERGGWKVERVDYDTSAELVRKHRITSLPTFVVLRDGKEFGRTVGFHKDNGLTSIERMIDEANARFQKSTQ